MRPALRHLTLEALAEATPLGQKAAALRGASKVRGSEAAAAKGGGAHAAAVAAVAAGRGKADGRQRLHSALAASPCSTMTNHGHGAMLFDTLAHQLPPFATSPQALFERARMAAEDSLIAWGSGGGGGLTPSSRRGRGAAAAANGGSSAKSLPASVAGVGLLGSEALESDARRKWGQAEGLSRQAAQDVLRGAHVVCATCAGAGDPLLSDL